MLLNNFQLNLMMKFKVCYLAAKFFLPAFIVSACFAALSYNSCSDGEETTYGVISSGSPESVNAGKKILEVGGNAVDAAIAISFTLAVSEPAMSGLGGQAQFLIHIPGKEPLIVNGTSFSPSNLPDSLNKSDLQKHKATTVPSMVRTLDYLWKNYGSNNVSWDELLKLAIKYAAEGFQLGDFRYSVLKYKAENLGEDSVTKILFLNEDGSLPKQEEFFKQNILAETLTRIATEGADDFYQGEIAQQIAEDMKRNNGWITIDDLNNVPMPKEISAIKGNYRGYDIYTMPPPGGGWVIIQALNILNQFPQEKLKLDSKERLLLIAQALQIAHKSRQEYPIKNLTNYKEEVNNKISDEEAKQLLIESGYDNNGETTHFSVVDKNGIVVSATLSINNYFGSKAANPQLGFLYNDYMNEFKLNEPGHPFNLIPGAMPYSSMTPTLLMRNGKPVMAIGSPGSERIISAIVQVISLWVDAGLSIEEAVHQKRIHINPGKVLFLEKGNLPGDEKENLLSSGFTFSKPPSDIIINGFNPYFGGVHAIAFEKSEWKGAADPRRDGVAGVILK
jgi:gamma-glutamyltranspeptidase/glutathione hydrolase